MSKYRNKKAYSNGIVFDSIREKKRYNELLLLERAGVITNLRRQVPFELVPAQYEEIPTGETYSRGDKKGYPKTKKVCTEKSVRYIADFVYTENGKTVVEDAKGLRTTDYIIKRKLMLYFHDIRIKEV